MTSIAKPGKFWWLRRPKYIAILLREFSSVFILAYVLVYVQTLSQLRTGGTDLVSQFGTTPIVILGIIMLAFSLYHSITWFVLLPKVQPVRLGGNTLRGGPALMINLIVLILASWLVAYIVFGIHLPFVLK